MYRLQLYICVRILKLCYCFPDTVSYCNSNYFFFSIFFVALNNPRFYVCNQNNYLLASIFLGMVS